MLDIKFIRENSEFVKKELAKKKVPSEIIDQVLSFDLERRKFIKEVDNLKSMRNDANDQITKAKQQGKPVGKIIEGMKTVSQKIGDLDDSVGEVDKGMVKILSSIPNLPHSSVPVGSDASANQVVREWGKKPVFGFQPKDHMELAQKLGWISFERGAKLTGSGFILYQNQGAKLIRALMNMMLDLHIEKHGYQEVWPPALVNRASMTGTGQLPKMEDDMYRLKDEDLFLIPTAEVPVTNIYRDETLNEKDLPIKLTAYSPCFRREAGSYGKDTKGLSRVHQFDKVELVKFVRPQDSLNELESLVLNAEAVLQLLELPYRVVMLCTGDLSFAAAKCYDLEVYAPGSDKWFEVSSCSMFENFQARRMNIKYKTKNGKTEFVHTLNGSGVAFARTILCLLENHQQADGSIRFPEVFKKYM